MRYDVSDILEPGDEIVLSEAEHVGAKVLLDGAQAAPHGSIAMIIGICICTDENSRDSKVSPKKKSQTLK